MSPEYFDVLHSPPVLGRGFVPEDGQEGHDQLAILTYPLWQSFFHGDRGVIGTTIRLDDVPRTVIGVLPAGFHFPNRNALPAFRSRQAVTLAPEPSAFVPAVLDPNKFSWSGDFGNWVALGRLKPGVTVQQAQTQLNAIQAQVLQQMPTNQGDRSAGALLASVQPLQEAIVGESGTALWILMAAVIGLMLIACLNLANAQLGRAIARRREAALRTALGAAKWRVIWNGVAETVVLAVAGGGAGILLASAALDLFRRHSPVDLPRLSEVRLNGTVLLFSIALACAAIFVSGMLPALRLLSQDPQPFLQQSNTRALGSHGSGRLQAWLIGFQVFGCTALLLITGLFSKTLLHLLGQERGFQTENVVVAEAGLNGKAYASDQSRLAFDDAVLAHLRTLPSVQAAGLVSAMILEGESWIESVSRVDKPGLQAPLINLRWVSPGYFEATRQKLIAGRFFEERDRDLDSVVLSEGEAKALWGNDDPIGGYVKLRGRIRTVIGVVADSRTTSLKSAPAKMAYLHFKDRPPYTSFFLVRGTQSADALAAALRETIWNHAPNVTIPRVKTLASHLNDSLARERFQTFVLMAFGIAALLLSMVGIYGVLSYSVAARKQEIGLRMALGATRARVYGLTFADAGAPVLVGIATGWIASILAGHIIQKTLYGTQAIDLPVILIVIVLFLVSAGAAAFLPARRAASVDPMDALRSE